MNFSKGIVFYWRTLYISKMVHFRVVATGTVKC